MELAPRQDSAARPPLPVTVTERGNGNGTHMLAFTVETVRSLRRWVAQKDVHQIATKGWKTTQTPQLEHRDLKCWSCKTRTNRCSIWRKD